MYMTFYVDAQFFKTKDRGTANESRTVGAEEVSSGPFSTRESAEAFARAYASQRDVALVKIREVEEGNHAA